MREARDVLNGICRELSECLATVSEEEVGRALEAICRAPRVFLAGAGRSGLASRAFAMRLMHLGKDAFVVGDVTTPAIRKEDLLVVGSGSGRTASLLAAASRARDIGARVLLVTIDPESPIGQIADLTVRIPAPSPKADASVQSAESDQPMGSLFEQSLFLLLDALVVLLMEREGISSDEMFARHANLE